jgi:hypothetical protein
MGKSIDPMLKEKAGSGSRTHSRRSSVSMSLQPVIPWRVALQQCPPPLHRPASECDKVVLSVNRYGGQWQHRRPGQLQPPARTSGSLNRKTDLHLRTGEKCPNNRDQLKQSILSFLNTGDERRAKDVLKGYPAENPRQEFLLASERFAMVGSSATGFYSGANPQVARRAKVLLIFSSKGRL